MSQAHKGSRLIVQDALYGVPYESAHFDFNEDVNSIQYGSLVQPSGSSVYTMREDGKFGKAVAIEEATTNLLYDGDVTNWSIANLTGAVTRTTIIANSTYRITSTTAGSFRFYVPLAKLVNATAYYMSFKWKPISGGTTFYMTDWCDNGSINRIEYDYSIYKYQMATCPARATYDVTFRFMDFNISASTVIEIWDVQFEQKSFATSFINGARGNPLLNYSGSIFNQDEFTVSAWVYPYDTISNPIRYVLSINSSGSHRYDFYINTNLTIKWEYYNGTTAYQFSSTNTVTKNAWNHITWLYKRSTNIATLFVNGVKTTSTQTLPSFGAFTNFTLGTDFIGMSPQSQLNGLIDELRVDRYMATDEEVLSWYIANKPFYNSYDVRGYAY